MRGMNGATDGATWSRMAILAVHALLLSAGPLSTCRVVAAASAGGSGWRSALSSVAALPHNSNVPPHPTTTSTTTTASPNGKLFRRHKKDEAGGHHSCETKGSSTEEDLCRRFKRGGRRKATGPTITNGKNMHSRSSRRSWLGWVHADQSTQHAKKGASSRKVLGVKEAVAAATGGVGVGTRVVSTFDVSRRRRQQQLRDAGGRTAAGWMKRFQSTRATSSSDKTVQEQQQQQQQQEGPVYATKVAAMRNTGSKRTPPSPASSAAASAAAPGGAASSVAAAAACPSPVPSYLQWPSKSKSAAAAAAATAEQREGGNGGDGRAQRNKNRVLSLGAGSSRTGRSGSSSETAATTTPPSGGEGSLGAAKTSRGGGGAGAVSLTFKEAMFAGAISRSIAQTCMQPANVVKTLLQGRGTASQLSNLSFKLLTRGAGAQFVMSLPHGAFNYATLEVILGCSAKIFPDEWRERAGPVLDFLSSSVATVVCSVVSTPQMVITDRIMAGMYPNLVSGVREISRTQGLPGFYTGWNANVAQKIPSYGLTWVFFQQFKRLHRKATDRPPTNTENFMLGAAAAGATVCIMIPMDTVKTRIVTQTAQAGVEPYKGVLRTLSRIIREEGVGPIYRSLTPRLVSVVPMIGIQFGIYEFVRKELMSRKDEGHQPRNWLPPVVREKLRMGVNRGSMQPDYVKDFLKNVYLMEEELM